MFKRSRLIAAAALVASLAVAGPVGAASAATAAPVVASTATPGSNIPCYPFPAFCGSDGQPAWWAPAWVRPALGLPSPSPWPPFTLGQPISIVPLG
jgi:hypothetical protein